MMDMRVDEVIVRRKKWSLTLDESRVIFDVLEGDLDYGKFDDLVSPLRDAVREAAEEVFAYTAGGVGYSSRGVLFPVSRAFREAAEYVMFGRMRDAQVGAVLDVWEFDYSTCGHAHVYMGPDVENEDTPFLVAPVPEPVAVGTTSRAFNLAVSKPREYNPQDTESYVFGSDMNPTHAWGMLQPSDLSEVADIIRLDGELEFDDPRWGPRRNDPCGDFHWDFWRDDVLKDGVEATYLMSLI